MSIENAIRNRSVLLEQMGKAALNVRYPNEFEMYICAFELMDQKGNTLKYFIFPVMPSQIDEAEPTLTNIKKTLSGVSVLSSPTFVPVDINLSGNFGRKFRVLLGTDMVDFLQSFVAPEGGVTTESFQKGVVSVFDDRVKTGYGCIKILQDIIRESNTVDDRGYRRLIFYNLAFGSSYVVKPLSFKMSMSQDVNMIHQYSLSMKAIAPLSAIKSQEDMMLLSLRLNATAYLQKQVDKTVNDLTSILTF